MLKSIWGHWIHGNFTRFREILSAITELRYLYKINERLLGDIIRLLEPFDMASRPLSTEKTSTIHLTLPTRVTLLKGLHVDPDDSDIISLSKDMLARKVEEKFHWWRKLFTK
ncbi:hypothetical protein AAFF_G00430380 [Aldrovandia affinis]|uniref:Uncharacterized protein n=1 Tax=Aldrovandia affinis TaxID=143900 RepID=A0AAD7S927_9TELE|nr:hypothetical protein AAFF_G00430380 [Aldrovandia affinis]